MSLFPLFASFFVPLSLSCPVAASLPRHKVCESLAGKLCRMGCRGAAVAKTKKLMQVRLMQDLDDFNELFLKVFGNN